MAKCPKCEGNRFELESVIVQNAPAELFCVKCSNCDTALTMFPPYFDPITGNVLSQLDHVAELFRRRKK